MSTFGEELESEGLDVPERKDQEIPEQAKEVTTGETVETDSGSSLTSSLKLLWKDSPNKSLEEYEGHVLNFDNSESTSRILRGLEGIAGNLNKAVFDVVFGSYQKYMELIAKGGKSEDQ